MNPSAVIERVIAAADRAAQAGQLRGFAGISEVIALVSYRADESGESVTLKVKDLQGVACLLQYGQLDQETWLEVVHLNRVSQEGKPQQITVNGRSFTLRQHSPTVFELILKLHPFSGVELEAKHVYRKAAGGVERIQQAYHLFGMDSSEWGWDGQQSYASEAAAILDAAAREILSTALSA